MSDLLEKYNRIKRYLLHKKAPISLETLTRTNLSHKEAVGLLEIISKDNDFICLSGNDPGSWRFINFKRIIEPFVELNLRLMGTFTELIPLSKIRGFIAMKFGLKREDINIQNVIARLSNYGLIVSANEKFSFPIHHLINYVERLRYTEESEIIINYIERQRKIGNKNVKNPFEDIYMRLFSILRSLLRPRQNEIIQLRYGLNGEKLTLEAIGNRWNITRERIRQIQMSAMCKLKYSSEIKQIKEMYYEVVVGNKGSIILSRNISRIGINRLAFILEILGIPFYKCKEEIIIGYSEDLITKCFEQDMLWQKEIDVQMIRKKLNQVGLWWVGDCDVYWLIDKVKKIVEKKRHKIHRLYITLKDLGRPSHYSEIALRHNEIFPEHCTTEHNIHAALTIYPDHFIWTGKHGYYALPEWGYERPKMGLKETCYKIVYERYKKTGKAVDFSYVLSQVSKYRKLVNPNSVRFSCYFNEFINVTEDDKLIPIEDLKGMKYIDTGEDYEKIEMKLREFEKSLNCSAPLEAQDTPQRS